MNFKSLPAPPELPVPVGAHDHAAQRAWERYSVDLGIARYHARQHDRAGNLKALSDRRAGADFGALITPRLVSRVLTYQTGIALATAEQEVHEHDLDDSEFIMTAAPAQTLAVVTVLSVLSSTGGEATSSGGRPPGAVGGEPGDIGFTGLALRLGNAVQREIDAAAWKVAEAASAKQRKASDLAPLVNLYRLMHKRSPEVDRRVFQRWTKKAPLFRRQAWADGTAAAVGANLVALLIQACPDYFCAAMSKGAGKWRRVLRFTPAAWAFMQQQDARHELARPFYLPMICEPRDHEYPPDADDGLSAPPSPTHETP